MPQVEGQGTEVTLENTIEAQFTIFDVEGNSTQETTEGKNLANIHVIINVSNQFLSRQIVGDTIVLSNNTNTTGYLTTEKKLSKICPNLKVNDIVKLSFKTTSTTAKPTNAIYLAGINQLWYINGVKTITQEMLDSTVILYGGYNETAVISEFMIRLSSITDDTYEKYTNGASPNPNYEQPIYSAGDNGSINEKIKNADGTEEQDYSIYTQQPMRSIGDVRDCFVKKSDGWYERHYIGEVILNSSENIARELISNNFYKFYINNIENVDYGDVNYVPQILCNKLIAVARTPMYLNTQGISSGNGNLQIYTDETKNMTVPEFKTWLENNKLIVNYLKTIPLDLPCTEEQIQQLENKPSTYKDFTYVVSEDETPAYLEVSGIYDLNNLINN